MVTTWLIQRRTTGTDFSDLDTVEGDVFSYQDNTFEIGTRYYYRVCKVIDGVSTNNWSSIASLIIASTPLIGEVTAESDVSGSIVYSVNLPAITTAISSVSGAIVYDCVLAGNTTAQSSLSGELSSGFGSDVIRIQRKIEDGEWADVATVLYSEKEYHDTDEDLSVGTTYCYRAIKENTSVHYGLGWSNESCATYGGGETTLAGVINSISTVSDAQLSVSISMAGTVTAESTVSDASLSLDLPLSGTITAISTVSSTVDVDRIISGLIGASTAISGGIVLDLVLAATSTPISSVSGILGTSWLIDGTVSAESNVSGELVTQVLVTLAGSIESQSTISANMVKTKRMMKSTAKIHNVRNQSVTHKFRSYMEDVES